MCKIITSILLILSCSRSYSQFYKPFPEEEAVWTINSLHVLSCPSGSGWATGYVSYIIQEGDTIISSHTYHKIYREPWVSPAGAPPYIFSDTGYLGALRQNIPLKQVYIFLRGDSIERLLYDFSVDTLGTPFPNTIQKPDNSSILIQIDTLWLVNSNGFTLYYLYADTAVTDTCGDQLIYAIVEGVGGEGLISKAGFFIAPGTTNYFIADNISCMSINGILVEQPNNDSIINTSDSLYCVTTLTAGFTELPGGYHIKIFPNPVIDQINIACNDLPAGHSYFYTVYNLLGKAVIKQQLPPPGTIVYCGNLAQGVYLWQVTDEQGARLTEGKLVKQ